MATRILRDELRSGNEELAAVFDRVYEESLKIWAEQHLFNFTTHGRLHTEQVERNLDSLTRPLQGSQRPLSPEEMFVLLSAACLHDIGMQRADDPKARDKHAQYSYELILYSDAWVEIEERRITLPTLDTNARVAIANVARAHWTEHALALPADEVIDDRNNRGRLRLLGLLLATADLLDLSPVRARYYNSPHRLFDLPALSELHQKMHKLVKTGRILPADQGVPGALQFRLEWHDDSEAVFTLSAWEMQWFDSQWRQLERELYRESGGAIGWAKPWATVKFNTPQGPVPKFSPGALRVLNAARAEQVRIDRDAFASRFRDAIKLGGATLFLFPADSHFDWRSLSEWCDADARLQEDCLVARVSSRPSAPTYVSGIVSQIMEQWGKHLSQCSDEDALKHLESFVTDCQTPSLVSIIRADQHVGESLQALLRVLVRRAESVPARARVCLLLSPGAEGPKELDGASVIEFDGSLLPRDEVERHLQSSRGYSPQESSAIYDRMLALKLTDDPARVYTYVENHCGL
jgi:hypothetical protein